MLTCTATYQSSGDDGDDPTYTTFSSQLYEIDGTAWLEASAGWVDAERDPPCSLSPLGPTLLRGNEEKNSNSEFGKLLRTVSLAALIEHRAAEGCSARFGPTCQKRGGHGNHPPANPLPGRRALTEAAKFSYQELWRSYGKQAIFAEPGFNLG